MLNQSVNKLMDYRKVVVLTDKLISKITTGLLISFFLSFTVQANEYRVAIRAHNGIENAKLKWQPTLDYLSKSIPEHTFTLVPVVDLKNITAGVANDEYSFVLTNPSSYVEISKLHNARALVTLNNKRGNSGQTHFGSVIFIQSARDDINILDDLKGKSLMAVTSQGFGGWRVAWFELLKNNIDPFSDLQSVLYTKSSQQRDVVYAVRDGKADAGIVRTDMLERMSEEGLIDLRYFRILNSQTTIGFPFFHSTLLYPEWPFAATKKVSQEVVKKVKNALLNIPEDNSAAIAGKYIGWVPALDYSSVDELMKKLQVGPYADVSASNSEKNRLNKRNFGTNTESFGSTCTVIISLVVSVLLLLVVLVFTGKFRRSN